jgi:hypothetical protein
MPNCTVYSNDFKLYFCGEVMKRFPCDFGLSEDMGIMHCWMMNDSNVAKLNVNLLLNSAWTVLGLKISMYDQSTDLLLIINITIH